VLRPESRLFIVLLATLTMISSLAIDMSLPALPALTVAFATTPDRVQLTLSLFLAGYAVTQLFYGPFSDRFGRRPVLLFGLVLYTVAGFACALTTSIEVLIAARFVQGMGCCVGPILSRAIVRDHFGGARSVQALSAITIVFALAPLVAPMIGGLLLASFGWSSIFLALGTVGLVVTAACWTGFGESLRHPDPQALTITRLINNYRVFFTNRATLGYGAINAFTTGGTFAFLAGSPYVLIEIYHVPSDHYGYYFGWVAIGLMLGAFTNTRLSRRVGTETVLRIGLAIMLAAGAGFLLASWTRWGGAVGVMIPMVVFVYSQALVMPNAVVAAMEPLPHMAGNAAALLGAIQVAVGSLVGYLVSALYDGTPLPMGATLAAMSVGAFVAYYVGPRRHGAAS
jgi:DHA1 family bicyclomycin/chloramphenicol resistance-like MFS transporter